MDVLPVLNQAAGGSKHSLLLLIQERAEYDLQAHLKAEFGARGKRDCAPESMPWFDSSRQSLNV